MGLPEHWLECESNDVTQSKINALNMSQIEQKKLSQFQLETTSQIKSKTVSQINSETASRVESENCGQRRTTNADDDAIFGYFMHQREGYWLINIVLMVIMTVAGILGP